MKDNPITSADKPETVIRISAIFKRLLSALLLCCAFLFSGCATVPVGTAQINSIQTVQGQPVKITRIPMTFATYANVQSAVGSVWASQLPAIGQKTIRIDPRSNEVTELSRSWNDVPDFMVAEHSIWYSDGMTLRGVDVETNQVTATIEDVGIPFASADGAVWAYSRRTHIVTGIDTSTNQIRAQLVTQGRPYIFGSFALGAGSIWQFVYSGSVSWWQANGMEVPALPSVVRRIDPYSKKVIALLPRSF